MTEGHEAQIDALQLFVKKAAGKLYDDLEKMRAKRPREDEEPVEVAPKETKVEEFSCAGRVWEDPPQACPGGPKSTKKAGIRYQRDGEKKSTIYTVCAECKLALNRERKKQKKSD